MTHLRYLFSKSLIFGEVSAIFINIIFVALSKKKDFHHSVYTKLRITGIILSITAAAILFVVSSDFNIIPVLELPLPALLAGSSIILAVYYFGKYIIKKNNDYEADYHTTLRKIFSDVSSDIPLEVNVVKQYAAGYRKANRSLRKKGKRILSTADYFERQNKRMRYVPFSVLAGLLIGIAAGNFGKYISLSYAISVALIYAVCVVAVISVFRFISGVSENSQSKILAECRLRGVDVDEFYDMLLNESNQ